MAVRAARAVELCTKRRRRTGATSPYERAMRRCIAIAEIRKERLDAGERAQDRSGGQRAPVCLRRGRDAGRQLSKL
jgi:hypothetical protein